MPAKIIDGKNIAKQITSNLIKEVKKNGSRSKLIDIVIGNDKLSHKFADIKGKKAKEIGLSFEKKSYPENFPPQKIIDQINEYNADTNVGGIVIQLPLPEAYLPHLILKAIHPFKDVDCLHQKNIGLLLEGHPVFVPPVVLATLEAIRSTGLFPEKNYRMEHFSHDITIPDLKGLNIVILGGGILVGKPLAAFLINELATITVVSEFTKSKTNLTQNADIVITGTNQKDILQPDEIKDGSILIDIGNDIETEQFLSREITLCKNPGGVGPLTVAFLLQNILLSQQQ